MSTASIIGGNVKGFREKMGLKQDDLGRYLGVQREVISYYENGTREIPIENLRKLSDLFGVELYDLMEENSAIRQANVAFAFRADEINPDDLKVIANFKKIVRNYIKLNELKGKNEF